MSSSSRSPSGAANRGWTVDRRPGTRLVVLLAVWLVVGLGAVFTAAVGPLWGASGGALLLFGLWDLQRIRRPRELAMVRQVATTLPLGVWSPVKLRLTNPGASDARVQVFDHYPTSAALEGLPWRVRVPSHGWAETEYRVRPETRGDHVFESAEVLVRSPLGLWERRQRVGERLPVRVLPNFRSVAHYALLAIDDRLAQLGIRLQQRRGEGLEFHQLREYRDGDSLRQIDWKATARRRTLISKEYQDEKDQQVVFLIDCGRRMHARDGELSHFDHVLNTVLLLTHVALRQGDAVGLMTFSGPGRWVPPRKGGVAMNAIVAATYDLATSAQAPDYQEAAERLMGLQRRRALIILVSNLRDEDSSEIGPTLKLLGQRNLVLLASLREAALHETLERAPTTLREALLVGATHHYLWARQKAHDRIRGQGVLFLDVEPRELPIRLVNRYLEVKRSGLL